MLAIFLLHCFSRLYTVINNDVYNKLSEKKMVSSNTQKKIDFAVQCNGNFLIAINCIKFLE